MSDQAQQPHPSYPPGHPSHPPGERGVTSVPVSGAQPEGKQQPPVIRLERKTPSPEVKDGFREIIETIVFVVVLVLLLKTFIAEAFVIPTGSMATTLLGYHKDVVCEQCHYRYLVNASQEAEKNLPVDHGICPNCGFEHSFRRFNQEDRER
jgi:signal peptidase I